MEEVERALAAASEESLRTRLAALEGLCGPLSSRLAALEEGRCEHVGVLVELGCRGDFASKDPLAARVAALESCCEEVAPLSARLAFVEDHCGLIDPVSKRTAELAGRCDAHHPGGDALDRALAQIGV